MKRATNILLTIGWVLGIIGFIVFIISAIAYAIGGASCLVAAKQALAEATTEEGIAKANSISIGGYVFISLSVFFLLSSPLYILAYVFARKGKTTLLSAKTRSEARPMAITNIVFGALTSIYPLIVAGVLMLTMNDERYQASL